MNDNNYADEALKALNEERARLTQARIEAAEARRLARHKEKEARRRADYHPQPSDFNLQSEKGYTKNKHIACHQQAKALTEGNQALKDVLADINRLNAELGFKLFSYQPGDTDHAPTKEQKIALQYMVSDNSSSFKKVFCTSLTKSPFVKRIKNGRVTRKQIRPLVITLNPQKHTRVVNKALKAFQYKKVDAKKRNQFSKIQVVYPVY